MTPAKPRRRRLRRLLLWLVGIAVVLRAMIWVALPMVVQKVLAGAGFAATWERLDLSVLSGTVELWRLELRPAAGGPDEARDVAEARVDYAIVDLDVTALLSGTLRVRRAEVDGCSATFRRGTDGVVRLCSVPLAYDDTAVSAPEGPAAAAEAAGDGPWVFTPPLQVLAARVVHAEALLVDGDRVDRCRASVRVSDFGVPGRDTVVEVDLDAAEVLDALRIRATGRGPDLAAVDLSLVVRGLHPRAASPWLEHLGLQAASDHIDVDLEARTLPLPPDSRGIAARAEVTRLQVRVDGAETASLGGLRVVVPRAGSATATVGGELRDLHLRVLRRPDGTLGICGFDLTTEDRALPLQGPASALDLLIQEVHLAEVSAAGEPATFRLVATADDLAQRLALQGRVQPFDPRTDLRLQGSGITLARLEPLLRSAGLAPQMKSASLECSVRISPAEADGIPVLRAAIEGLVLRDGDIQLAPTLGVEAILGAPTGTVLSSVSVSGPDLELRLDGDGVLHVAGFRLLGGPTAGPDTAPPPEPGPVADAAPFHIGELVWRGPGIVLRDETATPARTFALEDIELSVQGLTLGIAAPAARVALRARPVGIAGSLDLTGTIGFPETTGALSVTAALRLEGTTLESLGPFLAPIVPDLRDGQLALEVSARLEPEPDGLVLEAEVRELVLAEDGEVKAGLQSATVRGKLGDGISLETVAITAPRLSVHRLSDGTLLLPGLRIPAGGPAAPGPGASATQPATAPSPFQLGRLAVRDLDFSLTDEASARTWQVTAEVDAEGLRSGDDRPARFRVAAGCPDLWDRLEVAGELNLSANGDLRAAGEVAATGIRTATLAPLLPAGTEPTLADGTLRLAFVAELGRAAEGGTRAAVQVDGFTLAEGDGPPILAFDQLRVTAERLDPEAGVRHFSEVRAAGVAASVTRTADGRTELLGLRVARRAPPGAPPAVRPRVLDAADPPPDSAGAPPALRIDRLDIDVASVDYRDESRPGSVAARARLRLHADEPIQLGDNADDLPPTRLRLEGSFAPLVRELAADVVARPSASAPELRLDFALRGIAGDAIAQLWPDLAETVTNDSLEDGTLSFTLHARARSRVASRTGFRWNRDFALEAEILDLQLTGTAAGPVLAGIDEVRVDARRIAPQSGIVEIRTVELLTPRLRITDSAKGLRALGLLFPRSSETPEKPAAVVAAPAVPVADVGPASPGAGEWRIDSLLVQDLDFVYRDESVSPPLVLPFQALDAELTGYTSLAHERPETIRFRASVAGGKLQLPPRLRSSLIGGLLSSAASAVGAGQSAGPSEYRSFMEELSIQGQVALSPSVRWQASTDLTGFELTALGPIATKGGVVIGDGVLNANLELAYDPAAGLGVDSVLVFQHLSLQEPAGGPISGFLRLPAPLDTVLYVLRDANDEQVIPLVFRVPRQGLSGDRIAGMAVATLSTLITKAIATSPFRVLGTITNLIGLTGGAEPTAEQRSHTVPFTPGGVTFSLQEVQALAPLAREVAADDSLLAVLRHDMGGGDLKVAARLANPTAEECLALVGGLRGRRDEALRRRALQLQEVRVKSALEGFDNPQLRETVRSIDREIGQIERNLDDALELLRRDSEQARERRTRDATLQAAYQRLEAIRSELMRHGVPAHRIEIRRPRFVPAECDCGGFVTVTPRTRSRR